VEPLYLEDLAVGQEFVAARRTLTEADIDAFAGISGDFNPLHMDEAFVKEHTPFRGRIAHGLLVLAISSGLQSELDGVQSVAYLEERREFVEPAYPGDTIHARWRIDQVRPSASRPGTGVVHLSVEVVNQDDEVLQRGTDVWLVLARPHAPASSRVGAVEDREDD
jgi:3-hydroxybutyryl-CoA dehydratase